MQLRYRVEDESDGYVNHAFGDVFVTGDTVTSKSDLSDDNYSGRIYAASECAEHFWNEHAGDTYGWPLTLILLGEGDEELGRFSVDVETTPRFSANEA